MRARVWDPHFAVSSQLSYLITPKRILFIFANNNIGFHIDDLTFVSALQLTVCLFFRITSATFTVHLYSVKFIVNVSANPYCVRLSNIVVNKLEEVLLI